MDEALGAWLRLREAADVASRAGGLTRAVVRALPVDGPLRLLDLATGTGSNIRYLAERLQDRPQQWLAVDRSAALLAELPERMAAWAEARGSRLECRIETRQMDLGDLDEAEIFAGRHLVTASALLDLVSAQWLEALASRCRHARACALFTITYNGHSSCTPPEPEDERVRGLMNRHQKTDKGLGGPAAGPDAVDEAIRAFTQAGYRVERQASDWRLAPEDAALQRPLIEGWAHAATELAPGEAGTIASWLARRLAHVEAGRSHVVVGHDDLAAWPVHE